MSVPGIPGVPIRRRAPSGWRRIAFTECGAPVYTPKDPKIRKRDFRDCLAFVSDGAVYVRSEQLWETRRDVQLHEMEHLKQARYFGPLFHPVYDWCNAIVGRWKNPFEVEARRAEKPPKKKKSRKGK